MKNKGVMKWRSFMIALLFIAAFSACSNKGKALNTEESGTEISQSNISDPSNTSITHQNETTDSSNARFAQLGELDPFNAENTENTENNQVVGVISDIGEKSVTIEFVKIQDGRFNGDMPQDGRSPEGMSERRRPPDGTLPEGFVPPDGEGSFQRRQQPEGMPERGLRPEGEERPERFASPEGERMMPGGNFETTGEFLEIFYTENTKMVLMRSNNTLSIEDLVVGDRVFVELEQDEKEITATTITVMRQVQMRERQNGMTEQNDD